MLVLVHLRKIVNLISTIVVIGYVFFLLQTNKIFVERKVRIMILKKEIIADHISVNG
jgi:hypothetical protein